MSIVRKQAQLEGRTVRVPFGAHRFKLQLSDADKKGFKERGMVPRWFNDQDGRIERALAGGYTFVDPDHARSLGQGAIHQGNQDIGSKVGKVVSRGEPIIWAYLMEISEEFYKADQDAKEAELKKIDEALRLGEAGGAQIENKYGVGVTRH